MSGARPDIVSQRTDIAGTCSERQVTATLATERLPSPFRYRARAIRLTIWLDSKQQQFCQQRDHNAAHGLCRFVEPAERCIRHAQATAHLLAMRHGATASCSPRNVCMGCWGLCQYNKIDEPGRG